MKAFRVVVQCRKRKLAETSNSAKSATSKEATARLQSAENCPEYVSVSSLSKGMSRTKRSYRNMLWHIVMSVMLGLEEYTLFVNGMVGIVLSRLFVTLAKFRIGDAHSRKQEVDRGHGLHRCFSVSSHLSLHANAEWRERAWTETQASGTWNRAAVEVETKRRPRDPGRRCEFAPGSR